MFCVFLHIFWVMYMGKCICVLKQLYWHSVRGVVVIDTWLFLTPHNIVDTKENNVDTYNTSATIHMFIFFAFKMDYSCFYIVEHQMCNEGLCTQSS